MPPRRRPTGPVAHRRQHVGNARTYLIAWLSARAQGGTVGLRIEDIDSSRNKPGAAEQAVDDLRWLGLDWDGEPVVQTRRLAEHEAALERLKQRELVYPCTCTRADVAAAASAPHADHEGPTYPGTCAHRRAADAATLDRPYAWRFRVTDSPAFADGFLGETHVDLRQVGGDFVVWKSAGTPAYQLAVVVDDAAMGVTEVVRGDDLIPVHAAATAALPGAGAGAAAVRPRPAGGRRRRPAAGEAARRHPALGACGTPGCGRRWCWGCWRGRAAGRRRSSRSRRGSCCRGSGWTRSRSGRSC